MVPSGRALVIFIRCRRLTMLGPAICTLVLISPIVATADPPVIIDKPIDYGAERIRLTIEYRRAHYGDDRNDITIVPRVIVLHSTETDSFATTWQLFNRLRIDPARARLAKSGAVNVSAHFVVDRDGTIYRLMPETAMARHAIGLNEVAIGIENVGEVKRRPLTDAQVTADAALIRYLAKKYPIRYLIGHSEYRRMEATPLFGERDPRYRDDKEDPGEPFLTRVRAAVAGLHLAAPP
jgi:N-acetyl-anhydromuramyl-L-alanine amidase AmpD